MQLMHNWETNRPEMVFNTYEELIEHGKFLAPFVDGMQSEDDVKYLRTYIVMILEGLKARVDFGNIFKELGLDI